MQKTYTSKGDEDRLSIGEAASLLGVHPDTLRRWDKAGHVQSSRTPTGHRRFKRADIEALSVEPQTSEQGRSQVSA